MSTTWTERALRIEAPAGPLIGVATLPRAPAADIGVVIVVGGPQVRAGSHRQFVLLARHLAAEGFAVLRFDLQGMGDSPGELRHFEAAAPDVGAAVDSLLAAAPGLRRVVLWGLCDGASAALLYLDEGADPRVAGLVLVNPWVRNAAAQARTQVRHYYRQRLADPTFWRKLLRGAVGPAAWRDLWRHVVAARRPADAPAAAFQSRMCRAWLAHAGPKLLLLSGNDYTAREFEETVAMDADWQRALRQSGVERLDIAGADHTFSDAAHRRDAERATAAWLRRWIVAAGGATPSRGALVHAP